MRIGFHRPVLLLLFLLTFAGLHAQKNGYVMGRVKDQSNNPLVDVEIRVAELDILRKTDSTGRFRFTLPVGKHVIAFQAPELPVSKYQVTIRPGATEPLYVVLKDYLTGVVVITDDAGNTRLPDGISMQDWSGNVEDIAKIPTPKIDVESKLGSQYAGVVVNNEFSSQYRVRGGNFDENLIYVNGIEIYRPFLIRSGQQEGLGFTNSNLVSDIKFSTGGFEARYGDKMSSVLDVTYKTPHHFHGSAELGIISQNFHLEGSSKNKEDSTRRGRFTYLFGARRFTTVYLLNSLDTQGDYRPDFLDAQGMLTFSPKQKGKEPKITERRSGRLDTLYFPSQRLKFSAFFNVARNNYSFIPQARETQFGTIQSVLRLRVAFEGREIMSYLTSLGSLMMEHRPHTRLSFKYIVTAFRTIESEQFDVEGGYWLSDVNTNFGNEGFNEVVFDRGIGTNFRHGRNFLNATVLAAQQRAFWFPGKDFRHRIDWGVRYQRQIIEDELVEWNGVDSAGYFRLDETIRSKAEFGSAQYKVYLQDNWKLNHSGTTRLVFGSRAVYNDLNDQFYVSPRATFIYDPTAKRVRPDTTEEFRKYMRRRYQLRASAGVYQQPPFYREMRDFDGSVNTQLKAQTSVHFIAGGDYQFSIWKRPFKLFAEGYYKLLYNVIPYEVDNVRIRYYPNNIGKGYAYGLDMKINGEFIRGVDSWASLSLLKTQEDIEGDGQGYIPRPTDQRFTFSMMFQDELPINPTYKVQINFVYGSGLRFGPPRSLVNRTAFGVPAYNRVDLGFSKQVLLRSNAELEDSKLALRSLWVSVEIFNLFQRANTVSYTWIKDIFNSQYAVPNFLSARLVNARVIARF